MPAEKTEKNPVLKDSLKQVAALAASLARKEDVSPQQPAKISKAGVSGGGCSY